MQPWCTSLILDIHVMINWHLSKQGIHWPVSHDHFVGSSLELRRSHGFEVGHCPSTGFWLDGRFKSSLLMAYYAAMLCHAMVCYATLRYAMQLCYTMVGYAMLCYATMLCYAMVCYAILRYAMLCYAMLYAILRYGILCYAAMLCYIYAMLRHVACYTSASQCLCCHILY